MSDLKLRKILEVEITGVMYDVVVGNFVGNVYHGENEKEARKVFKDYVEKSDMGYGSVGHEPVTLLLDGLIIHTIRLPGSAYSQGCKRSFREVCHTTWIQVTLDQR